MTDSPEEEVALEADAKLYQADMATAKVKAKEKKIPLVEMFGPTVQGEGSVIGQQTYFLRFGLCDYRCTMCDSLHAVLPNQVKRNAQWITQEEIFKSFMTFWHIQNGDSGLTTRWITYSGGNPCIHDLHELTMFLKTSGFSINVETQGTFYPDYLRYVDSITVSPKGPGMGEVTDIVVLDEFMEFVTRSLTHDEQLFWYNFGAANQPKPDVCMKIVCFDQRDLDFAADMFQRYTDKNLITYNQCYLSLGNPYPPQPGEDGVTDVVAWKMDLLKQYAILFEDIKSHPVLSQVKFLPQWHAFVWGNGQGH